MHESGPAERVQPAMHQHVGILTGGTLVSAAYAVGLWGTLSLGHWAAAAIFVLLIYVHELGHVVAARRYHVPWTTAPVFALSGATRVPMYATPADPVKATAFYLSGPVLGALGAVLAIACGQVLVWSPVFDAGVAGVVWNWIGVLPLPPSRIRTDGTVVLGILALAGRAGARRRILGIYLAVLAVLSLLLVLEHQPIHAFWAREQRAVPLWFRRQGTVVGYGYVRLGAGTIYSPQACTLGPIGARTPDDAGACVLAAVAWARPRATVLLIDVPGPHPGLAALLDARFRITYVETFMAVAHTPFLDPRCYVASGGTFF